LKASRGAPQCRPWIGIPDRVVGPLRLRELRVMSGKVGFEIDRRTEDNARVQFENRLLDRRQGPVAEPPPAILRSRPQQASRQKQPSIWEDFNMKRWSAFAIACLLVGLAALSYSRQATADAGWITLFDGKNLDNFIQIGTANWRIEDGAAVADKGNGFLVTKDAYTPRYIKALKRERAKSKKSDGG
jgi:hypothetical protein